MPFKYKRILLKISGEALGKNAAGLDFGAIRRLAEELAALAKQKLQIAVVVGGGNIFRGRMVPEGTIDRATADYMGMVGTLINGLALQAEIEKMGVQTRVMSALSMKEVAEDYIRRRASHHLEKGRIVLFACGTGNPYFTTDTAAALRALEINAQVLLKATTHVDGVYSADPSKNKKAKKFSMLSFQEALVRHLKVMDSTAFSLCQDNKLPLIVFKYRPGVVAKILAGEKIGTLVN